MKEFYRFGRAFLPPLKPGIYRTTTANLPCQSKYYNAASLDFPQLDYFVFYFGLSHFIAIHLCAQPQPFSDITAQVLFLFWLVTVVYSKTSQLVYLMLL